MPAHSWTHYWDPRPHRFHSGKERWHLQDSDRFSGKFIQRQRRRPPPGLQLEREQSHVHRRGLSPRDRPVWSLSYHLLHARLSQPDADSVPARVLQFCSHLQPHHFERIPDWLPTKQRRALGQGFRRTIGWLFGWHRLLRFLL